MGDVKIKISIVAQGAEAQLRNLQRSVDKLGGGLGATGKRVKGFGKNFDQTFRQSSLAFGRFGTLLRAGIIGGTLFGLGAAIRKTINDFKEYEVALVGVSKTTNLSGAALEQFGSDIQRISLRIPVATNELLDLSRVAAQLGIRGTKNLQKFAETAARLAVSTDVSAESAILSLSRIINITGESEESIDNLGASLVELGNTFKAQESEILDTANEVNRATAGFGLAGSDILAIAASLREAGVQSEAGGTAIGKVFREASEAIAQGGSQLEEFTKITGLTADQLEQRLATDAAGVFKLFINGLSRASKNGTEFVQTLTRLELNSDRVNKVLRPLAQISDRVTTSFDTSSEAFAKNSALVEESDKQFNTVTGALQKLDNAFTAIFTNLGRANTGVLKGILDQLVALATVTAEATDPFGDLNKDIAELDVKLFDARQRLQELNKVYVENADATVRVGRETVKVTSLIGSEALQIDRLIKKQNELVAARTEIIEQRKKEREAVETSQGGTGGGENPEVTAEREKQLKITELRDAFFQGELERLNQESEEKRNLEILNQDSSFQFLSDSLGQEAALQASARAQELIEKGKFDQARLFLAKKFQESQQKNTKAQIALDRQVAQQRIGIAGNLGAAINAIAGKETKAGFLLQKAAAAAQIIVQGQIAEANALATLPVGAGATLIPLIKANTALQLATVAGTAIAGFQDGGVVGGTSFTGDNVTARVNSGEMILNRAQQAELFAIARGQQATQQQAAETTVNTTVEIDGEAIAKAVSKQVDNGIELGEFV